MENQHRKITGYRELSQAEIDLMNRIKAHAEATKELAADVAVHLGNQSRNAAAQSEHDERELTRIGEAAPSRWLAIARTDLQTGFMALTRAVAQPTTF